MGKKRKRRQEGLQNLTRLQKGSLICAGSILTTSIGHSLCLVAQSADWGLIGSLVLGATVATSVYFMVAACYDPVKPSTNEVPDNKPHMAPATVSLSYDNKAKYNTVSTPMSFAKKSVPHLRKNRPN